MSRKDLRLILEYVSSRLTYELLACTLRNRNHGCVRPTQVDCVASRKLFCSRGLLTHLLSCNTTIASSTDTGSCTCKRLRLGAGTCNEVVQSSLPLTAPCRPLFRPISGAEDLRTTLRTHLKAARVAAVSVLDRDTSLWGPSIW